MEERDLRLCAVDGEALVPLCERVYPAPARAHRTAFQRDRDRIVQARAFRRLAGKTQVFYQPRIGPLPQPADAHD